MIRLHIAWTNLWRRGIKGFLVSCGACGRTIRVHHFRNGPRLHMCYCAPRGIVMGMTGPSLVAMTQRYNRLVEKLNAALPAEAAGRDRVAFVKWMTQELRMQPMGGYRASDSLVIPAEPKDKGT